MPSNSPPVDFEFLKPFTKSSRARLQGMADAIAHVDRLGIAGDIVECGVWRGGNIILARQRSPERVCWLYDTFAGMTEPGEHDRKPSGTRPAIIRWREKIELGLPWMAVSLEDVKANLRATGTYDDGKLRFVAGDVCQTLKQTIPERIALLRLDTDWHESTKAELKTLYPLLQPGGVLIVDDYGHWHGARKAVDDYFRGSVRIDMLDYSACRIEKPC